MRRLTALAGAAALAIGVATGASAGEATIDGEGEVLVFDVDVFPPRAASPGAPGAVTLDFHHYFSGEGPQRSMSIRLARGLGTNAHLFVRCRLPESQADTAADRCPRASRIGSGTALVDTHLISDQRQMGAELTAFNGERRDGIPTLIVRAVARGGGRTIVRELDFHVRRIARGRFGLELTLFDPVPNPAGAGPGGFILRTLDLRVGRTATRRSRGRFRKVPYWVAPRTCSGFWSFEETLSPATSAPLTAGDFVPCVRGR